MYEPPALLLLLIMQEKRDGKSSTKISDVSFRPVMAQTRRRSNEIERLSLQFDERCVERRARAQLRIYTEGHVAKFPRLIRRRLSGHLK